MSNLNQCSPSTAVWAVGGLAIAAAAIAGGLYTVQEVVTGDLARRLIVVGSKVFGFGAVGLGLVFAVAVLAGTS